MKTGDVFIIARPGERVAILLVDGEFWWFDRVDNESRGQSSLDWAINDSGTRIQSSMSNLDMVRVAKDTPVEEVVDTYRGYILYEE